MEIRSCILRPAIVPVLWWGLRLLPLSVAVPDTAFAQPGQPGQPGSGASRTEQAKQAEQAPMAQLAQLAQRLRQGGLVLLLRHAETDPGVGDPPGFQPDDCPTQRNLNEAGRTQARRIGEWFRQQGITPTRVLSSPWCRTRETARLAFDEAEDWLPLSNLIADRSRLPEHAKEVLDAIARVGPQDLVVLVSHGVTIDAFIGEYLRQGEIVIVRPAAGTGIAGKAHAGAPPDAAVARDGGGKIAIVGRLMIP